VPEQQPAATLKTTGVATNYQQALDALNLHLAGATSRAEASGGQWLLHELAARAWLFRARLTGSYDDYSAAEGALRRSESMAAPRTGPHMTGAMLSFSMHRLSAAENYLDQIAGYAIPPRGADLAETHAFRGDIAFYRGDYSGALLHYDEADGIARGTADFRRAIYHSKTGRPDLSERYIDRAEVQLVNRTRQNLSFFELHRGILDLDRGRLEDALVHFRRADNIFPGSWLIEEHIAEVATLKGDLETAEKLYSNIVHRTGHPEFIDALAGIAAERGDDGARKRLTDIAARAWTKRLKQFPEAAYGHALDHCIGKEDWACALNLAQRNHDARPYGEAKIALARALLGSGRKAEAKAMIEAVLASPWRTTELHRTAAEIYSAEGMTVAAAEQDRLARRGS
jgi:tetratricopeptide (TPR) repeat protein